MGAGAPIMFFCVWWPVDLLDDLGDPAGAHGAATLADRETQTFVHGDGLDQLHRDVGVVTGHHHLGALRQCHHTGHVGGAEVELRTVVVEERRVPAALVLGQDVDLAFELGVTPPFFGPPTKRSSTEIAASWRP